jgi:hypothetical protein
MIKYEYYAKSEAFKHYCNIDAESEMEANHFYSVPFNRRIAICKNIVELNVSLATIWLDEKAHKILSNNVKNNNLIKSLAEAFEIILESLSESHLNRPENTHLIQRVGSLLELVVNYNAAVPFHKDRILCQ